MKYSQPFAGEYQIEKTLERSQYSVLCQGRKSASGQQVLLKLWLTAQITSESAQRGIREEVAALQRVIHPHLLPLLEVHVDEQKVFLVSEYAPEGSLSERLEQENGEAFSLDEKLRIIGQVGQALQELHAHGIVHGNLTPQAIFFSRSGQVKLGDVLIRSVRAHIQDYQHILDENVPHCFYMAPEQFRGRIDAKTDQYALGCLAYVLLTGRVPFTGTARATLLQKHQRDQPQALSALNPTVPAHIEAAVFKSLAKNPKERYTDVQAFLEALDVAGKKGLADQSTFKYPVPDALSGTEDASWKMGKWEVAALPEGQSGASDSTIVINGETHPSFPVSQLYPGRSTPPSQKRRARYMIIPAVLLFLLLLLGVGRWLFFPGGFNAVQSQRSAKNATSAPILLTSTSATGAQTPAATPTRRPTATPTARPDPTATPKPTATPVAAQVQILLTSFFNNEGIGNAPGQADFDGSGYSYPADQLPAAGQIKVSSVSYLFPGHAPGTNDNITTSGQTITLTPGTYRQAFLLAAASWGPVSGMFTIRYTDGSTETTSITVPDWYQKTSNGLSTTERYSANGIDLNAVSIYVISIPLNTTRIARALLLPALLSGPHQNGRIHIFSLTLLH